MIRKIFSLLIAVVSYLGVYGQNSSMGLVTANSDVIGLSGIPTAPQLIQSGPENFYWIGGSYQGTSVDHPLLSNKVISDFSNIYFIRYDKLGNPLASAAISGTSYTKAAFSPDGGMTLVASDSTDVIANGNTLPIGRASQLEFIAKYNDLCQFERIVSIWDLEPNQYPNSRAAMDPETGDLYLTGVSYQPFNLIGHGLIGKEWGDYLYVLRYDSNLALTGVFTAGFDVQNTEYGYYRNLRITPGVQGSVIISGIWQGDRTPVIDGDTLTSTMANSQGVFTFKLDAKFKKEWLLEGSLKGFDYDGFSGISEGIALSDGDLVMVGASSTGHFSLGEVKIDFDNGASFSNMFAFRISAGGSPRWIRPLNNRDEAYIGKKGAESEEFTTSMEWDAIHWNEEVLYLTGKFSGDQFLVAGRPLGNMLGKGAFVAAIEMKTGEEKWGYSLSSSMVDLNGFDLDGSGNVSLLGRTGSVQVFEGFGNVTMDGTDLLFHLGLDNQGKLLWFNNAYLGSLGDNHYACDLEVLKNGEVFSTLYKTVWDPLLIGGASLTSKEDYSTWLISLSADNLMGGKVTDKSGNPLYPGIVKAYKITDRGAYPLVQTVNLDEYGTYLFSRLLPGDYAFLVVPDRNAYPDGMPTYSGGGITWGAALTQIYGVAPDTRATLNVGLSHLDPLTELDGSGKMSGSISFADDYISKSTMARPVTGTGVILKKKAASKGTQEDDIVAFIETDEFGAYYFNFVPDGEYNMIVDIPGLNMINNYDVEIIDNTIVGELDFVVENDGIYIPGSLGVESLEMKMANLFPNPGNGNLHMEFSKSGDYLVKVFNPVGKMVEYRNYLAVSGTVELDLTDMESGIYLIWIKGDKGAETVKYVRE